jgi:Na+/H+ antiporter NhaD/arsenite permease-like protein
MKVTASSLIRWSGLAALVAGLIFAGIQPIHPPDVLSSVTTGEWAIITTLKLAMCLLFLLGIAGIYARQVERAGWLGLAGFLLLTLSWWLQTAFVFAEAYILPQLATAAPQFVESFLGS